MCMKTKGSMTQCPIIHRHFWPKNAKVRDNRSEIRVFLNGNARIVGREAEKCSFLRFTQYRLWLLRMAGWAAVTCLEGPRLFEPTRRCAPSPQPAKHGAPFPLRLVRAPAAVHPLPRGERAGDLFWLGGPAAARGARRGGDVAERKPALRFLRSLNARFRF